MNSDIAMELMDLRVRLTCPSGCHCVFPDDPDMHECGCDGACTGEVWNSLRETLEEAHGV